MIIDAISCNYYVDQLIANTRGNNIIETPSILNGTFKTLKIYFTQFIFKVSKSNLDAKIKAMESYIYEKKFPHPRSPEALEILAKDGLIIGAEYAESFEILRLSKN